MFEHEAASKVKTFLPQSNGQKHSQMAKTETETETKGEIKEQRANTFFLCVLRTK